MTNAQLVVALVPGAAQASILDDKKAALTLAKECPTQVTAIDSAMGKFRGPDGKWA